MGQVLPPRSNLQSSDNAPRLILTLNKAAGTGPGIGIPEERLAALILVECTPEIIAGARALLLRHHLRAGDAVQLASCLYLQRGLGLAVPFVAFDERLTDAASDEGLTVVSSSPRRR